MAEVFGDLPGVLTSLWQVSSDVLPVWAVCLVVVAVVSSRRLRLVRDELTAGLLAGLGCAALDVGPIRFAVAVSVVGVASPHLSRPLRYVGRWLVPAAAIASLVLELATPWEVVAAWTVGIAAAGAVRFLFGSPGGRPSPSQVQRALAGLGVEATVDGRAATHAGGMSRLTATGPDGERLVVKVLGRDAWDSQLLTAVWRAVWYRGRTTAPAMSRKGQVEHEAFLTMLAGGRGVPVTEVVAAGTATTGDALLVVRSSGHPLGHLEPGVVGDDVLVSAWSAVGRLHREGMVHGGLDGDRLLVDDLGSVALADFPAARFLEGRDAVRADQAQVLVATALVVGPERALAVGHAALGSDGLSATSSILEPAVLTSTLRREVRRTGLDLDDLRSRAAELTGIEPPELERLRRVTVRSVLTSALLLVAGAAFVNGLADIGVANIVDALAEASVAGVVVALLLGQVPRVALAFSVMAASPAPLALGPVVALMFATTFVNLAVPSTAARVAMNIRFFQRNGASRSAAVATGALDGVSGFVAQVLLLVFILLFQLGTLDLTLTTGSDRSGPGWIVGVAVAALVVAGVVLLVVGSLRRWIVGLVTGFVGELQALRSPGKVAQMVGANLVAELLFAATMAVVLAAFGVPLPFADVVLINVCVALFAGLMPVPGGIGVTEAALTAGFVAAGVDDATALAAAITYRLVTFYLPPIWGAFAFRWLQRENYL